MTLHKYSDKAVHALWIGEELSPVELLCAHSFIDKGHEFHLWLYNELKTPLPKQVVLEDASEIIPVEQVFAYTKTNQFGHGKGSYAGFSDIFRYKLLHEIGGWWTDMDVVCLKPLGFEEPYVFRTHHDFPVVGNIMKCPPKSMLMLDCYNEAVAKVKADNTDWHLPIAILNKNIQKYDLGKYIKVISNPDRWHIVLLYCILNKKPQADWLVLHLMNEQWRKNNISKNTLPAWSAIGRLMLRYDIFEKPNLVRSFRNALRFLF